MKTLSNSWESRRSKGERTHDVCAATLQSRPTNPHGVQAFPDHHRATAQTIDLMLRGVVPEGGSNLCRRFCAGGCVFSLLHNQEPWPRLAVLRRDFSVALGLLLTQAPSFLVPS